MEQKFLFRAACCLFLLSGRLCATEFTFQYQQDDKYRMTSLIHQEVYLDGELSHTAESINKVTLRVLATEKEQGRLAMTFQIWEKIYNVSPLYQVREEILESLFWRDARGRYSTTPPQLMPTIRDVPVFPAGPLQPGDTWTAEGQEYHDFRYWGIATPLINIMEVNYIYLRNEERNGSPVAVLKIYYMGEASFTKYLKYASGIPPSEGLSYSSRLLYWDLAKGRVQGYEDEFTVRYFYANGRVHLFKGTVSAWTTEIPDLDKPQLARELAEAIRKDKLTDVDVLTEEDGVTLRLANIQFQAESAELAATEKTKLQKIGEILKRYPERDLLIGGHTAQAGTATGRQELSEKRARAVGEYLLQLGVREPHQLAFQWFGAARPLADNNTAEGMRLNRRVEIKLLE